MRCTVDVMARVAQCVSESDKVAESQGSHLETNFKGNTLRREPCAVLHGGKQMEIDRSIGM